jgi:bacterioferritin
MLPKISRRRRAQMLKQRGFGKLADKIMAESDEEWDEAKKVNARLIELGVTPKVELTEYPVFTDIKEMLEYDCKDAAAALPEMCKAALNKIVGIAGCML